jgi:hypothetical protein
MNHLLPFSIARGLGVRTSTARSQLAMHTIVLGAIVIPVFYAVQTGVVWRYAGPWWALVYIASLIPSASWDIRYTERLRQLRRRAMAWRHFREDPGLQSKLHQELSSLRREAASIASGTAAE